MATHMQTYKMLEEEKDLQTILIISGFGVANAHKTPRSNPTSVATTSCKDWSLLKRNSGVAMMRCNYARKETLGLACKKKVNTTQAQLNNIQ